LHILLIILTNGKNVNSSQSVLSNGHANISDGKGTPIGEKFFVKTCGAHRLWQSAAFKTTGPVADVVN
jgi:hypothetical protein